MSSRAVIDRAPTGTLRELLGRFRWPMAFALSLVVVENVAWIAEPSVFGPVIDAMISRASHEAAPLWQPLALWIGVFAVNSGVGSLRRSVDPRIYLGMRTEIATSVSRFGLKSHWPVSTTAARAQLSEQLITFLQYQGPQVLEEAISIGGALIALTFYDVRIAVTCGAIVLPLLLVGRFYRARVGILEETLHNRMEHRYEVFASDDPGRVHRFYRGLALFERKIANIGAATFGLMRVCLLIIFLIVLYVAIDLDDLTTGRIYSVVAYIWTFVTSTEYVPELLENWTALKDIARRLDRGPDVAGNEG